MNRNSKKRNSLLPDCRVKLDQTLAELEKALNVWDELPNETPEQVANTNKITAKAISEDLRRKTKELLEQLRQQLADLD